MALDDLQNEALHAAEQLIAELRARELSIATAESLTCGLISATLASVPGASEVLQGGAATYTEKIKHRVLNVTLATLRDHTAVSTPCAQEMATGARELFESDLALSATGYAGPGGGTEANPVGTVYIGCATAMSVEVERHLFEGSRDEIRLQVVITALGMAHKALMDI